MPLLKDGSFLLDDSSCNPYGVTETQDKSLNGKKRIVKKEKKNGKEKKK